MIIGNQPDFFLQIDIVENPDDGYWYLGICNFWIDDLPYPGNGTNITLNSTLPLLVGDYEDSILKYNYDGSNLPLEEINFEDENNYDDETIKHHLCSRTSGEFFDYGLETKFEIFGDTLRFFYSQNEGPWQLKEIPLAYYDSIMKKLDLLIQDGYKALLNSQFK